MRLRKVQLSELKSQKSGPELNHFSWLLRGLVMSECQMDLGWVGMTQVWSKEVNFKVDFNVECENQVGLQGGHSL